MLYLYIILLCVVVQATNLERQDTIALIARPIISSRSRVKQIMHEFATCFVDGCRLEEGTHESFLNYTTLHKSDNHLHNNAYICPHRDWSEWKLDIARKYNTKALLEKNQSKTKLLKILTDTTQWRFETQKKHTADQADHFIIYNKHKLVSKPAWFKYNITVQPRSQCLCYSEAGHLELEENNENDSDWRYCGDEPKCIWKPSIDRQSMTLRNVGFMKYNDKMGYTKYMSNTISNKPLSFDE